MAAAWSVLHSHAVLAACLFLLMSTLSHGAHFSTTSANQNAASGPTNVLGGPLESCCTSPVTGFYRDGFCRTDAHDHGRHVICSKVTQPFLEYSRAQGNDLMTPHPPSFPGLKDGDKWCLCASRWDEARVAGVAPGVYLKSTHVKALEYVSLEELRKYAVDNDAATA